MMLESVDADLVLFDGTCGFCAWSLALVARCFEPEHVVYVPYQWLSLAELAAVGTTAASCATAVHLWDGREARLYRGADAFNRLVATTAAGKRIVSALARCAPILAAERALYAVIARNRLVLSRLLGTRRYAVIVDESEHA